MANEATMQNDAVSNSASEISELKAIVTQLKDGMAAFSGTVVQLLSGQPQTAPAQAGKRRGRPPKASAAPAEKAEDKAKPLHPIEIQMSDIILRAGRITQSDLAAQLSSDPDKPMAASQVEHHVAKLLKRGQARCEKVVPPQGHPHLVYYRPDWFSTRTGGK